MVFYGAVSVDDIKHIKERIVMKNLLKLLFLGWQAV